MRTRDNRTEEVFNDPIVTRSGDDFMYVYRTDRFNQKVEEYGLQSLVDRLCDELETQNLEEAQSHFKRLYPYLKRKADNNFRLIGKIVRVNDALVLCLLYIFKRGAKEYEHFLKDRQGYGKNHLDSLVNSSALQLWFEQRKNLTQLQSIRALQEQPDLLPWLDPPGWERDREGILIYESEVWLTQFKQAEIRDRASLFSELTIDIIHVSVGEATNWLGVQLYGDKGCYALFSRITTTDTPKQQVIFLLAAFIQKPTSEAIKQVGQATHLFSDRENLLSGEIQLSDLTALARRAYPSYLLADENWLAGEGTKEPNLALSAEEEAILHSVSTAASARASLPLFLNGRAGSGKSTMLFYLFADYCDRKFFYKRDCSLPGKPLFLTYNERLLEVAKDWVYQLLTSHHRFVTARAENTVVPDISEFFQPFQKFLLKLLPTEVRVEFNPEKYITFHRFKQNYKDCSLILKRKYSPERCWHVIRTFIKGYGLEDMTSEDYQEEVPRKERTVPVHQFEEIYQIWHQWYRKLTTESGYWDDQDLVRKVIELKRYQPIYTAIFCDEAQDFTRLELQFIMRLSIFSQYDLGYQPVYSLPFAFAGDPFQTLNPTGFRWESFQAAFYNEVITALDPTEQLNLGMNFQELECNYRSCSPIVKFNNLIQLWRQLLFDLPELKPQSVWRQGQLEPQKFILEQNISLEELRNYIQDTIVIVPCEEGEETAYLKNDEVLSQIFSTLDEADPPKNVLSAIAAKGLEFKRVVLYKFGEACDAKVGNFLRTVTTIKNGSTEPALEVEYFFNKLYVAASRARERLFAIDSVLGDRKLWQFATDLDYLETLFQTSTRTQAWKERVHSLEFGTSESAEELREDDPESIAKEFEEEGLNSQNPQLLRRAKHYYRDIGNSEKAEICEAWAVKFEEKFCQAGNAFMRLGIAAEAWECFWQGLCWTELENWYRQYGDRKLAEKPLIDFMAGSLPPVDAIQALTQFLKQSVENQQLEHNRFSNQWQNVIAEYVKRIERLTGDAFDSQAWQDCGEVLEALDAAGFQGMFALAGTCFYRASNYDRAVSCYTRSQATPREYYLAKAMVAGFPTGLEYLAKAGESSAETEQHFADRIEAEWEKAGKPRDRIWLQYVAPALERQQRYQKAFVAYIWLDNPVKVKACFERIFQTHPQLKLLKLWVHYLGEKQLWLEAIAVLEKYLSRVEGGETEKMRLQCDLVYAIAQSQLTPEKISVSDRKRYEVFINNIAHADWQKHLLMQQVGVALEKIGGLGVTLSFYQHFCEDKQLAPVLRQFARERWLVTKKKQAAYHRSKGKSIKAESNQLEIVQKSQAWGITLASVPVQPPAVPPERPLPVKKVARTSEVRWRSAPSGGRSPLSQISGLPEGVSVELLKHGIEKFQIRHLVIKLARTAKQAIVTDILAGTQVRLDLAHFQVYIGEVTIEATSGISFSVPASGYKGAIVREDKTRLELQFLDPPHSISIDF